MTKIKDKRNSNFLWRKFQKYAAIAERATQKAQYFQDKYYDKYDKINLKIKL